MRDFMDFMEDFWWIVPVVAVLVGGGMFADSYACHARWTSSGFQCQWGPVQGCLISKDGQRWVPADSYREIAQ